MDFLYSRVFSSRSPNSVFGKYKPLADFYFFPAICNDSSYFLPVVYFHATLDDEGCLDEFIFDSRVKWRYSKFVLIAAQQSIYGRYGVNPIDSAAAIEEIDIIVGLTDDCLKALYRHTFKMPLRSLERINVFTSDGTNDLDDILNTTWKKNEIYFTSKRKNDEDVKRYLKDYYRELKREWIMKYDFIFEVNKLKAYYQGELFTHEVVLDKDDISQFQLSLN